MHYIIGTQIVIQNRSLPKVTTGMSSQQLSKLSRLKRSSAQSEKARELFEPGKTYTLIRIFAKDQKVIYKFSDNGGTVIEAEFDSVKQAENFISEARGEEIPDYSLNHINKTD